MSLVGMPAGAADGAALDFTLKSAAGGNARLAEQRGQPVWLAAVAPWCDECPGFLKRLADRAQLVAATSVSIDDASQTANDRELADDRAAATTPGDDIPLVWAVSATSKGRFQSVPEADGVLMLIDRDGEVLRRLDPPALPWLYMIDADGNVTGGGADIDALTATGRRGGMWGRLVRWWQS